MTLHGDANVAKRPDIRRRISDRKWQGYSFVYKTCGDRNRCMLSRLAEKRYCSQACRAEAMRLRVGEKAMHWKGGRTISPGGYVYISNKSHPFASSTGYVAEHRLVIEKRIGRFLKSDEIVHHINGDKTDNRISNLLLVTRSQHMLIHHPDGPNEYQHHLTSERSMVL